MPSPERKDHSTAPAAFTWPAYIPTLSLDGIAQGGEAVGRYRERVVFVQGGLPGELVSVCLSQTRKTYARGHVQDVHRPAPERIEPSCPIFGRCGGCQWQYIAYPAQLAFKRIIVQEQCCRSKTGPAAPVLPTLGVERPWAYRSTAKLHLSPKGEIGYYAWHSHEVVAMERCPLLVDPLNRLIPPLSKALQAQSPAGRPTRVTLRYSWAERCCLLLIHGGDRRGALRLRDTLIEFIPEIVWQRGRKLRTLAGRGFFHETLGGSRLRVSPNAFFQVNVPQAKTILQTVLAMLEPHPQDSLLDAYAGVGALSLPLALGDSVQPALVEERAPGPDTGPGANRTHVAHVTAIESGPAAAADLGENVRQLGLEQVEPIRGTVEAVLPSLQRSFDLAILDPPRRGCHPKALAAVVRARPRRIAYVSCHPGILARDLGRLYPGGYRLVRIQPLDLFPQTFHVESVALLERVD